MARIEDDYARRYIGDLTFRHWGLFIGASLMLYGLCTLPFWIKT